VQVLLVHGLGRTRLFMLRLALYLQRHGVEPHHFGYGPAFAQFDAISLQLQRRLEQLAKDDAVAVGHSLGGLLLRKAIAQLGPDARPPCRLIMLGTPNQSPRLARRVSHWALYRIISGDAGRLMASLDRMAGLPVPRLPITVIAGTAGPAWKRGPLAGLANDGLVAVSETRLGAGEEFIELPVRHAFMMNHPDVRRIILERCRPESSTQNPELRTQKGERRG
jgi:pimeloyl-ACP methyl ester carboxylesterase